MLSFFPHLKDKSLGFKFLILLLLIAISILLTNIIGIIIAIPIFGAGIIENLDKLTDINNPESITMLKYFQIINQAGVFVLPALLYAWLESRKTGDYLRIYKWPEIKPTFFSILLIIASIPVINWMVEINGQMKLPEYLQGLETWMKSNEEKNNQLTELFLKAETYKGLAVNLIIIAFMAAIGEELLFRGVVLRVLYDGLKNSHVAVLISAVLFSAMHIQFYGFLPRMFLGILLGYIFIWTGKLWIPILLHFLFNGITVVGAFLYNKGIIQTDVESLGNTSNILILVLSAATTLFFVFLLYKDRVNRTYL